MHQVTLARRLLLCSLRGSSPVKPGRSLSLVLLVAAILFVPIARASAASFPIDDSDAPDASAAVSGNGRAVRLSYLEGSARVTQGDQVIADPAVINMPLFEGAEITTATDGRAEIQLEDGSIVRLSPNTTLDFTVMQMQGTAPRTELTLRSGLAYFELEPSNAQDRLRIRYDDASVTASEPSIIRVTHDAPPTELAVLSGSIHLERQSALQLDMHSGESVTLDPNTQSRYNLASSIQPNSWDNWNADRDQALNAEAADQTVATTNQHDYPSGGNSDLDANGNWYSVPGEGYVWAPYEAQDAGAGWDPYGYGNWVDYPQYGYVWVSGYPWGYSPFACGLWNYYDDFGWAWAPGPSCSPWWGGGGWGYRIGNHRPPGYRPPHRPRPPLHNGGGVRPAGSNLAGMHHLPPNPIVPVDHRAASGGAIPVSRDSGSVTIAGHTVEPLHPIGRTSQGFGSPDSDSNVFGNTNAGQGFVTNSHGTSGNPSNRTRPIYTPSGSGAIRPQAPVVAHPEPSRPVFTPAPRYSPPPAPHYSAPPAPRSSPPASHPHH